MSFTEDVPDTTAEELRAVLTKAATAAVPFAALPPAERGRMLAAVAGALEASTADLVPLAQAESGLPEGRLRGELTRTAVQLRMFVEVLRNGGYADVVIDRADEGFALGARPELRRARFALGPVLVFAASNFPFAFSVAGGDTAAALAAGCPVIVKAHPGHPRLSARVGEIVTEALRSAGAPEGVFGVVYGKETGVAALRDPVITAASFTGSIPAGLALARIAAERPVPIPFYGELGSVNPVFVTPAALAERGERIAREYVDSFTLGAGQFCTSPGLLFLPSGHGLEDVLVKAVSALPPTRMLTGAVHAGYAARRADILKADGIRVLAEGQVGEGLDVTPTLVSTDVPTLLAQREQLLDEAFGPLSVIVEYDEPAQLPGVVTGFPGSLTATVHTGPGEHPDLLPVVDALAARVGRLLFNGWPTGVAVTPAMHHGGPFPATTSPLHTSVGARAIDRFLRPVVFQNAPEDLLPPQLREDNPWDLPRTVDEPGGSVSWGR
ncbi:aldehyde dehydrogenase (NADP(+)) [Amycolatopsis acidiphila]|uniref:Aldehyde dehydrogenase (NADP(+)) n=1 Tax=Amycolatopsis acidiphila TaxID=715473 RepID=A0A558AJ95_9PSEU|nr:aldehyde dehydrogenase (NADP(+)) [Amycolatopsis acidiphila]TVT24340.1 aldehyde dehydrogenase (NADP(+)) [Amycolatopsis acidiphila]UIJ62524.1 aldehyde dehydrogenase (NADP(+)) [Amycolatopsis acidiphila]GHG85198.1 aldehyde dehydrogenase [Amycolatopsis acidiphila]